MSKSIVQAERNVEHAMEGLRRVVRSDADDTRKLNDVEREVWSLLLALGRALVALFFARRVARRQPAFYEHRGVRYFVERERVRCDSIGTLFGKVALARPLGRPVSNRRGAADLFVDRELGLVSGFSLATVVSMTRLCAQMPFEPARRTFREFCQWAPSPRATLRMIDATGPEALAFMLQAPCPEGDGEVLVIECDAGGDPRIGPQEYAKRRQPKRKRGSISREERRARRKTHVKRPRAKGKKSKNSKSAVIGVTYTLKVENGVVIGPLNKRIIATHEGHERLFELLQVGALERGYGIKKTVFLSDGSEHILERQRRFFPLAIPCLDWCHAAEYIWTACSALHREGSKKLEDVAAWLKRRMLSGDIGGVIAYLQQQYAAVPKTGPGNKGKRQRLEKTIKYLDANRERLRYSELRKAGLPIGSGVVEGAVRNLIRQRLDCSGMRWGLDRSEHVLHLRCVFLNKQWADFERHLEARHLRLAAQPEPARPYEAKPQTSHAA
jgi:hypothetical protein